MSSPITKITRIGALPNNTITIRAQSRTSSSHQNSLLSLHHVNNISFRLIRRNVTGGRHACPQYQKIPTKNQSPQKRCKRLRLEQGSHSSHRDRLRRLHSEGVGFKDELLRIARLIALLQLAHRTHHLHQIPAKRRVSNCRGIIRQQTDNLGHGRLKRIIIARHSQRADVSAPGPIRNKGALLPPRLLRASHQYLPRQHQHLQTRILNAIAHIRLTHRSGRFETAAHQRRITR